MTDPAFPDPESSELLATLGDGTLIESDDERGWARMGFTCKPQMCHSGGIAQGGFVTAWVDSAMAHACIHRFGPGFWVATLELKVSFFKPVPPGPVLAEGWIVRAGKQIVFTEGRVTDEGGEELARASSTIRLVTKP